jgi:hypothetical protein
MLSKKEICKNMMIFSTMWVWMIICLLRRFEIVKFTHWEIYICHDANVNNTMWNWFGVSREMHKEK